MQSIYSIETYACGMNKDLVCKKEEIKYNKTIQKCLTLKQTKADIKEHNPNGLEIPGHPYRISIVGGSGSGKTNALHNLINNEADIDKNFYMLKIHMKQNINY